MESEDIKTVKHHLETIFDIEEGTTQYPVVEIEPVVLVDHPLYDDKDKEIENQFQEVIDYALGAFKDASNSCIDVDPKYKARNEEVAAQYLNTALQAISQKSQIKQHKDRLEKMTKKNDGKTTNIVLDRNQLLRALQESDGEIYDGEIVDE